MTQRRLRSIFRCCCDRDFRISRTAFSSVAQWQSGWLLTTRLLVRIQPEESILVRNRKLPLHWLTVPWVKPNRVLLLSPPSLARFALFHLPLGTPISIDRFKVKCVPRDCVRGPTLGFLFLRFSVFQQMQNSTSVRLDTHIRHITYSAKHYPDTEHYCVKAKFNF